MLEKISDEINSRSLFFSKDGSFDDIKTSEEVMKNQAYLIPLILVAKR